MKYGSLTPWDCSATVLVLLPVFFFHLRGAEVHPHLLQTYPLGFSSWDAQNLKAPTQHPLIWHSSGTHMGPSWGSLGHTRYSPEELLFPELPPATAELQLERDLTLCRAGDELWLTAVSLDIAGDVHFGQTWKGLGVCRCTAPLEAE